MIQTNRPFRLNTELTENISIQKQVIDDMDKQCLVCKQKITDFSVYVPGIGDLCKKCYLRHTINEENEKTLTERTIEYA